MKLHTLLDGFIDEQSIIIDTDIEITGLALDSRKVEKGFVFIAVSGTKEQGLVYLQQAIIKGACAVIYDYQGSEGLVLNSQNIRQIAVENLTVKLGYIASRFHQSPSKRLNIIGITGTNGKTSCSQFLAQLIPDSGVIGTLGWGTAKTLQETINTTPDGLTIQKILADFVLLKKQSVIMEISSHGLQQDRVNSILFKGAVFLNLTRDHLDYHGSMDAYLQAKLTLFKHPELQFVVVNSDDEKSIEFLAVTDKTVKQWAFSSTGKRLQGVENVIADNIHYRLFGIDFSVRWRDEIVSITTPIIGDFNVDNLLAVITVLLAQGNCLNKIADKIKNLVPVSGRMERLGEANQPLVLIDYAHTPDALKKVLQSARRHCQQRLWLIFGCGGNRDQGKRSEMGRIAEQLADQVVVTNDNPRFENAEQIIRAILATCTDQQIKVIENREKAIQTVIKNMDKNDCLVIAGKGHENYQEIKGVKQPFSDQAVAKQALLEWDNES